MWPPPSPPSLPGHAFEVPEVMFRKIADEEREGWEEQFAGTRT